MKYAHIFLMAFFSVVFVKNAYSAASGTDEVTEAIFYESLATIKRHVNGGGPSCFVSRVFGQGAEIDKKCDMFKDYLKSAGIKTVYDTDNLLPGQSKHSFMEQIGITKYVVVLFTPKYKERSQVPESGIDEEVAHMVSRLRRVDTFYIPIILEGTPESAIPEALWPTEYLYYDLTDWNKRFEVVFAALQEKMLRAVPQLPAIKAAFEREKTALTASSSVGTAAGDLSEVPPTVGTPLPTRGVAASVGGAGAMAEEVRDDSTTLEEYRRAMAYKLGVTDAETALLAGPVGMAAASTTTGADGAAGTGAMPAPAPLKRDSFEPPAPSSADGSKPAAIGAGALVASAVSRPAAAGGAGGADPDESDSALQTGGDGKGKIVVADPVSDMDKALPAPKAVGSISLSEGDKEAAESLRKKYLDVVNLPANALNNFSRKYAYSQLKRCAAEGDIFAQGYLCMIFCTNQVPVGEDPYRLDLYDDAVKAIRKAAEENNPYAQMILGSMYFMGIDLIKEPILKDPAKTFQWTKRAAAQEYPIAQHKVGLMYETGTGVTQSDAEAFAWYKKAAILKNADAQFKVGEFLANGKGGVEKSEKDAVKWFRLAAQQEHELAKYVLGSLYADGKLPRDSDAIGLIEFAAKRGYTNAEYSSGHLSKLVYISEAKKGKIDKDFKNSALLMLGRAAKKGHEGAARELAELNELIKKEGKCEIM